RDLAQLPHRPGGQPLTDRLRPLNAFGKTRLGVHRAVAADPERLLPHALETLTTQPDADGARQWLTGIRNAVIQRARRPDAEPTTYEQAVALIDQAQTAVGIEGIDEPPESEETGRAAGFQEQLQARPDTRRNRDSPMDPDLRLVKLEASRPTRLVITALAICHLTLVTVVSAAGLTADTPNQWALWFVVPEIVGLAPPRPLRSRCPACGITDHLDRPAAPPWEPPSHWQHRSVTAGRCLPICPPG
ncbi:hypothetical protein ACIHFE_34385, partial [Streptomyces sp. NPDC052396]|uniref:hypothetical protein n=1 Tax=Streptomyces sp. NPDC052396 TaxID=3365689 RepID=UPI0037CD397C